MPTKEFLCMVCERSEKECTCSRYCALCQAEYGLRLCVDGQFYCPDCREACDYLPQDKV